MRQAVGVRACKGLLCATRSMHEFECCAAGARCCAPDARQNRHLCSASSETWQVESNIACRFNDACACLAQGFGYGGVVCVCVCGKIGMLIYET